MTNTLDTIVTYYDYDDANIITETGEWDSFKEEYDVNISSIATKLIQEIGTYCKNYASDFLITWKNVEDLIHNRHDTKTTILFGIREMGVDGQDSIKVRLNDFKSRRNAIHWAKDYYYKIYAVCVDNTKTSLETKITLKDITNYIADLIPEYEDEIDKIEIKDTNIDDSKETYQFIEDEKTGQPTINFILTDSTHIIITYDFDTHQDKHYKIKIERPIETLLRKFNNTQVRYQAETINCFNKNLLLMVLPDILSREFERNNYIINTISSQPVSSKRHI